MWILPKQLHTSAYAQDTKALGLDSEEFSQICEKSLTWRGKDSLSRTWLQRWKRESWMQHLSSRTLKPSLTESFVDAWTSSLEDSRANHSAAGKRKATEDPRHLFPYIADGIRECQPRIVFSKTWQESSLLRLETEIPFSNMSSENWKDLGYRATAGIFSAEEVGAPHQRKRVFIMGYSNTMYHMRSEESRGITATVRNIPQGTDATSNLRQGATELAGGARREPRTQRWNWNTSDLRP
jgi:hypothetical protein